MRLNSIMNYKSYSNDEIAHVVLLKYIHAVANQNCEEASTVNRGLQRENLIPWKFTTVKEFKDTESQQRVTFCNFAERQSQHA